MHKEDITSGIEKVILDSWEEFLNLTKDEFIDKQAYIYRGQTDSEWKVKSTLDRLEEEFPRYSIPIEGREDTFECPPIDRTTHFRAFKEAARGRFSIGAGSLSEDEWWALAQHHGLATPLLDWTYSPFVALYFAFEKESSDTENRAVYVLSSSSIQETELKAISFAAALSPRLSCQGSISLKMPPSTDLEGHIAQKFEQETASTNRHARAVLLKIVIRNVNRKDCLKYLNKMNINRMTLFPDLDGAAQYINNLWELDFDSSIGFFTQG